MPGRVVCTIIFDNIFLILMISNDFEIHRQAQKCDKNRRFGVTMTPFQSHYRNILRVLYWRQTSVLNVAY